MKRKKHERFYLGMVIFAQIILLGSITNSYFVALVLDGLFLEGQHIPIILLLGTILLMIFYISIILLRINHNLEKLKK